MKKFSSNEKAAYSLAIAMLALFLCAVILVVSLLSMLSNTEKQYSKYRTDSEIRLSDLEKKKNEIISASNDLKNSLELAEKTKEELERRIGQTENELRELKNSIGDSDSLYKKLDAELTSLKAELGEKKAEIEALKEDLKTLQNTYAFDINKQYGLLVQLYELLNSPPQTEVSPAVYGNNGELISKAVYEDAKISIYYEDVGRGHFFKYNETVKYPSSGCLETPFALSVLRAASEEQEDYQKKLAEYVAANGEADELPGYEFKYDLGKIFTYTEDKQVSGSGIIKDDDPGTEYTHHELFEYLIKYGDAIAYSELKTVYGTTLQKKLLTDIGTTVMKGTPSETTAFDLALIMKNVYAFLESDAYYAPTMKEAMISSVHNVMITPGIVGKKVAHSYGWSDGAYHDTAIVYDTHPYVLVFASNLDQGGNEINTYISKIASLIDDIHESFYGK